MKPGFQISANGKDITSILSDRLIGMKIVDVAGWKSDEVTISLDMRDNRLAVPPLGAILKVQVGYPDEGLWTTGSYKVDSIEISGPPSKLEVIGRATDFLGQMKAQQSVSWHQKTIGQIVAVIAEKTDLLPVISEDLKDVLIPHIDQTAESYMHFLTRLARDYGAIFKVKEQRLLFITAGTGKSAGGLDLPALLIERREILDYRFSGTGKNRFAGVKARWRNVPLNTDVVVIAGVDDPDAGVKEMTFPFATEGEARAAADAALKKLQRREESLEITIVGKPQAKAMFPVTISRMGEPIDGADWLIQRAEHNYNSSGLITRIICEKKNK